MAKKRKTALQQEYLKVRTQAYDRLRKAEKRGYIFSPEFRESLAPKKTGTRKEIERLKSLRGEELYQHAVISPVTRQAPKTEIQRIEARELSLLKRRVRALEKTHEVDEYLKQQILSGRLTAEQMHSLRGSKLRWELDAQKKSEVTSTMDFLMDNEVIDALKRIDSELQEFRANYESMKGKVLKTKTRLLKERRMQDLFDAYTEEVNKNAEAFKRRIEEHKQFILSKLGDFERAYRYEEIEACYKVAVDALQLGSLTADTMEDMESINESYSEQY